LAAAHAGRPAASSYLDARKAYLDAPTIEGARNVAARAYDASLDLAFDPDGKAFSSVAADAAKRVQWLEAAERGDTSWFRLESVPERQAEALRFRAAERAVEGPGESVVAVASNQGTRLSDALVLAMVVSSRDVEPGPIHAVCRAEKDLGLAPMHEVDRDRGRGR